MPLALDRLQIRDERVHALRIELELGHWMGHADAFDELFFQDIGAIALEQAVEEAH